MKELKKILLIIACVIFNYYTIATLNTEFNPFSLDAFYRLSILMIPMFLLLIHFTFKY